DCNLFTSFYFFQVPTQHPCGVLFNINLALEIHSVAQLHKLVGIPRVAVFAGKLTPAIRLIVQVKGMRATVQRLSKERAGRVKYSTSCPGCMNSPWAARRAIPTSGLGVSQPNRGRG